MNEVNEAAINEVKADLEAPGKPKRKEVKKVAKKVKKVAAEEAPKKKAKTNGKAKVAAKESDEGLVTVAALAEEANISPQSARVKLRSAELDRGEGRWKWEEGSKSLKAARKILGLEG